MMVLPESKGILLQDFVHRNGLRIMDGAGIQELGYDELLFRKDQVTGNRIRKPLTE